MFIKYIAKISDLEKFNFINENGLMLMFRYSSSDIVEVYIDKILNTSGNDYYSNFIMWISLENLSELKKFGLHVEIVSASDERVGTMIQTFEDQNNDSTEKILSAINKCLDEIKEVPSKTNEYNKNGGFTIKNFINSITFNNFMRRINENNIELDITELIATSGCAEISCLFRFKTESDYKTFDELFGSVDLW